VKKRLTTAASRVFPDFQCSFLIGGEVGVHFISIKSTILRVKLNQHLTILISYVKYNYLLNTLLFTFFKYFTYESFK
jgi:hypothetical protein